MGRLSDDTKDSDNQKNDNPVITDDKLTLNGDDGTKENIFQKYLKKHESQKADSINDKGEEGSSVSEDDKVCSNSWYTEYVSACNCTVLYVNIRVICYLMQTKDVEKVKELSQAIQESKDDKSENNGIKSRFIA